jgi:hypothetical protein
LKAVYRAAPADARLAAWQILALLLFDLSEQLDINQRRIQACKVGNIRFFTVCCGCQSSIGFDEVLDGKSLRLFARSRLTESQQPANQETIATTVGMSSVSMRSLSVSQAGDFPETKQLLVCSH